MVKANNWYVITGGPSTGKTTLLGELEKLGHAIIPEAARTVIDEALAKGVSVKALRSDEKHFQEEVVRLKQKIEATHDKNVLTFFDRGMHDTLAYFRYYAYNVDDWITALVKRAHYEKVFLLEPLARFEKDYARIEDEGFQAGIHKLLHDAYAEYGIKPTLVPAMPLEERVKFILSHVKQELTV